MGRTCQKMVQANKDTNSSSLARGAFLLAVSTNGKCEMIL